MRLQIAILSLLLVAGCSEWDRHRPRLAEPPTVVKSQSVFTQLCQQIIEKNQPVDPATNSTFRMLYRMSGLTRCEDAVNRILSFTELDLSSDTSTRYSLDLNLIASMQNLELLILRGHYVDSLVPLANMPRLAVLDASETGIDQDLNLLGVSSLPLERYRRLRLTVRSSQVSKDEGIGDHLIYRFTESLRKNELLVMALIDRGTTVVPITLDADPVKRAGQIEAWQKGLLRLPPEQEALGTFIDSSQVSEVTPSVILNRGFALDFTVLDHIASGDEKRDGLAVRANLLQEFADNGQGNKWFYPQKETDTGPYTIIISPTDPADMGMGRSGALPAPREAK